MRKLLIALVIIVGVAVVIDFVARDFAESRVGQELQAALELSARPDASIGGFPFLTQVIAGELSSITLEAERLRSRGVQLTKMTLELRGLRFSLGQVLDLSDRRVRIDGGRGRADLSATAITRAARRRGADVTVRFEGGRAVLSSERLPGSVAADLSLEGSVLVLSAPEAGQPIRIPLPRISDDLEYRSVEVDGSDASVTFEFGATTLDLATG